MFTIDPKLTEKDLKGKNIFKVLISMNNHQVATPETSLEEARSYVFFFREGRNRFSAYIGLHLLLTDRKLVYVHTANPFIEDELSEVEDEARDFAEYLGAMMDEVDIAGMSDLEQDSWIEDQGFFSAKKQPESAPVEQPPLPNAAAAAPAPQPPAAPEKAAPTAEAISEPEPRVAPEKPAPEAEAISAPAPKEPPVQPVPKAYPRETKEKAREAPVMETVKQDVQDQSPPLAATMLRKEIEKKEATTGIEMPPTLPEKKISFSVNSVVSRDREALARLLTSF